MKLSANRQSALEEIYRHQPISVHNLARGKRSWKWLHLQGYIVVKTNNDVATVTKKGIEHLTQSY